MSSIGEPIGSILDQLGVTMYLDPEDRVTQALVIAKTVNLGTGEIALMIASSDLDWIDQWGLHSAAQQVYLSNNPSRGDDA